MSSWSPLLAGSLAESARESAREIAESLSGLSRPVEIAPSYGQDVAASLASGASGLAVAFDVLSRAGLAPGLDGRAATFLEAATDAMSEVEMGPDLFGGFAGIAWAAARLGSGRDAPEDEDALSDVDRDVLSVV